MPMQAVYDYIAAHEGEALEELRAFCAQPSVSAEGHGLEAMAALVVASFERRSFRTEVIPQAGGYPIVYAESGDDGPPGAPTLLIYNHYDVQPAGDPALWAAPAFGLTVRDGKIFGRGTADTKGNIVSRLAAIDALRAAGGALPIRIKWIVEGEEEIGSPSLDAFLADHHDRLAADGCLWEFGTFAWDGTPQVMLGVKGIVTVELSVAGPNRDLHSSLAAYVAGPVWRLIWALGSLKDEHEQVLIDGFYDAMGAPSATDMDLVRALPDDTPAMLDDLGLPEFAQGLSGFHRRIAEIFSPTCNIEGIWAGYQGPGSKTILPREAHAKLDFRLVPDQDPAEIVRLLRDHLDTKGFPDVVVTQIETNLAPARSDPDHPFVQMAIAACAELAGRRPLIYPSSPASGPMSAFTGGLGLPVVAIGCAYPGAATHAPDENIRLADFQQGTRLIALLMARMAAVDFAAAPHRQVAAAPGGDVFLDTGLEEIDFAALEAEMAVGPVGAPAAVPAGEAAASMAFADGELDTGLGAFDFAGIAAVMAGDDAGGLPSLAPAPAAPPAPPPLRPRGKRRRHKK